MSGSKGMLLGLFSCVCPYVRPKGFKFKRNKKRKVTTADAATSTEDFYMYGSMYEINENCAMKTSIPSMCWTEISDCDFTDDEGVS
ncbi:hypothetical protein L596_017816 [Steinernema carpocapsae]|uniref:Uncharacterized protein n=1 Tax=Steinernema carpocapsae TaxID=34508 RepID=A0A4U5N348_STECR|nr:hypothetical protein L596_017816 [Steinernema carpocapsae]